jgi:hypothetical protein
LGTNPGAQAAKVGLGQTEEQSEAVTSMMIWMVGFDDAGFDPDQAVNWSKVASSSTTTQKQQRICHKFLDSVCRFVLSGECFIKKM